MLLLSGDFSKRLVEEISHSRSSILVCSAFMKETAVLKLLENVPHTQVTLISRWRKGDLLAGASDLEVYSVCQDRGWKFGIDPNLHGKIYLIDQSTIFLGSANLTASGLAMKLSPNNEFGTFISPSKLDLEKMFCYLDENVIWVDDFLFERMKKEIDSFQDDSNHMEEITWSNEVINLINKPIEFMWVNELLFCTPAQVLSRSNGLDDDIAHDLATLSLDSDSSQIEVLKQAFRQSKLCKWLIAVLREQESINFGGISSRLHGALIDDPTPYRKDVKKFVAILFEWIALLDNVFEITKHNVTSSVRLVSSYE